MRMRGILMCFFLSLCVPAVVFAGSGSAIMPHWTAAYANDPTNVQVQGGYIFMSNITNHDIEVTVTYYGYAGTEHAPTAFSNFSSNNTRILSKNTGYVYFGTNGWDYGYAKIKWNNVAGGGDDIVALVAHGVRATPYSTYISIPVNNGQPF